MAANPYRGEVEIELDGRDLIMRPTYETLADIEAATGSTAMQLIRRFGEHSFGFNDLVAIVGAGLKGAGTPFSRKRVAEMVYNSGLLAAAGPASELLLSAMNAGQLPVDEGTDDPASDDLAGDDEPGEAQAAEG